MSDITLEQIAVSDHDRPAAHQPIPSAQRQPEGICTFPHCKCGFYRSGVCPEIEQELFHASR